MLRRILPPFIAIAWGVATGYYIFSDPLRSHFKDKSKADIEELPLTSPSPPPGAAPPKKGK